MLLSVEEIGAYHRILEVITQGYLEVGTDAQGRIRPNAQLQVAVDQSGGGGKGTSGGTSGGDVTSTDVGGVSGAGGGGNTGVGLDSSHSRGRVVS